MYLTWVEGAINILLFSLIPVILFGLNFWSNRWHCIFFCLLLFLAKLYKWVVRKKYVSYIGVLWWQDLIHLIVLVAITLSGCWIIGNINRKIFESSFDEQGFTRKWTKLEVEVSEVNLKNDSMNVLFRSLEEKDEVYFASLDYVEKISEGSICSVEGWVVTQKSNEFYNWYILKNIDGFFDVKEMSCKSGRGIKNKVFSLVEIVEKNIKRKISEPQSSLLIGILFGRDYPYEDKFSDAIRASGLSHIVAASGYNVSIVMSAISNTFFFLKKRARNILSLPFIWVYAMITGFASSMVRACIMTSVSVIFSSFSLRMSPKFVFKTSIIIFVLASPLILFDIGFQLSVAATFGIMYLSPILEKMIKRGWFPSTTLACILSTLPITTIYFNTLSPYALIANAFVLPVIEIVMIIGIVGIIFPPVLYLAFGSLKYLEGVSYLIYKLPFSLIEVPRVISAIISVSMVVFLVYLLRKYRNVNIN